MCSSARFAAGLLLLVAAGCAETDEPKRTETQNLVLIVIDTLRADRLGAYGHVRDTSPVLDGLARDGVLFERAVSPAPWTKPAVGSILTGVYPSRHGLVRMGRQLPPAAETLAEIAVGEGYATGAVVSHYLLSRDFQFDQGFEHFVEVPGLSHSVVSSTAVTSAGIEVLDALAKSDRPFFLFLHYFDPHYTYVPHPAVGFAPESAGRLRGRLQAPKLRAIEPTPEEVAFVGSVYDEEIRFTDGAIGRFFEALEERSLYDQTLIAVTADHGEELHDRGWFGHTRGLHEELIRVPLVVRDPRAPNDARGLRIREPVSTVALLPTLLDLLGLTYEPAAFAHSSLAGVVRGQRGVPGEPVFAEVDFVPAVLTPPAMTLARKKAVVEGSWKLIRDERAGTESLYDLEADPGERHDVADRLPEHVARLGRRLDAFDVRHANALESTSVELTQEEIELLQALGYSAPSD